MIKRRRIEDLQPNDYGLFFSEENDTNPLNGFATTERYKNNKLVIAIDEDWLEPEAFIYWISMNDICNAVSEEYV